MKQQVYLYGEVITRDDLVRILGGYLYSYDNDNTDERYKWLLAAKTVEGLMRYLDRGKIADKEIE